MGIGTGTGCCGCEGDYCANIGPDPENAQWKVTVSLNDSIARCAGHWNGEHILSFLTTQTLSCGPGAGPAYVYQSDKEASPQTPGCNRHLLLRIAPNQCTSNQTKWCRVEGRITDCGNPDINDNFMLIRDGNTWRQPLNSVEAQPILGGSAPLRNCGVLGNDTITLERIDP